MPTHRMEPISGIRKTIAGEQRFLKRRNFKDNISQRLLLRPLNIAAMILDELRSDVELSIRQSIRAWSSGFTRFNYRMYGLSHSGNPDGYLSDLEALRQENINGRHAAMIKDKLSFSLLMKHCGMPAPEIYGIIRNGFFSSLHRTETTESAGFLKELRGPGDRIVLKPLAGWHGFGYLMVEKSDNGYIVNGEAAALEDVTDMAGRLDNYIVTEFITQGEYAASLYPPTTNTLRILTFLDPHTATPFIAGVVQRIGTLRSQPVDNFRGGIGGMSALVNSDTGALGSAALSDEKGHVTWHKRHPETGAEIEGITVPGWSEIRRRVIDCAGRLAFIPLIAWDIAVTNTGFSVIEGNPSSGMPVMQIHGPMLTDPRIRRFYKCHRVIK
jgi:hypothetical protein